MALFGRSGPKVVHSDEDTETLLDEAGMSFLILTIDELNNALKENGVVDIAVRQEICGSAIFSLAYRLDAGWLVQGKTKLFPKVCFAERSAPGEDSNLGSIHALHVPTDVSSLHEYAMGVVTQYFEDYEDGQKIEPPIRNGSYEIEN